MPCSDSPTFRSGHPAVCWCCPGPLPIPGRCHVMIRPVHRAGLSCCPVQEFPRQLALLIDVQMLLDDSAHFQRSGAPHALRVAALSDQGCPLQVPRSWLQRSRSYHATGRALLRFRNWRSTWPAHLKYSRQSLFGDLLPALRVRLCRRPLLARPTTANRQWVSTRKATTWKNARHGPRWWSHCACGAAHALHRTRPFPPGRCGAPAACGRTHRSNAARSCDPQFQV